LVLLRTVGSNQQVKPRLALGSETVVDGQATLAPTFSNVRLAEIR
jgi:hypothetical protein